MSAPTTVSDFLGLVRKSGLLDGPALAQLADQDLPDEPFACAEALVKERLLTPFQAKQLLAGRHRGLVLGAYRILKPLGKGGMGVVYLADHASLGRKVAIKVLTQEKAQEKLALERFQREARAAAALDHPNIVRLHDITQVNGVHFLVMEYVEGADLQSLMEQTGALHFAQAASYIAQAAAGLKHAHERGFVHRDIKPANLILAKDGTVKILDMGLARSVRNPKDELTGKLDDDSITGTADYLSPEQALNIALDARSDLYSLGATFFTLITGRPPYNGSTAQKLAQHQIAPPPDLSKFQPNAPEELNEVVSRMMAKKPGERFQTASEVMEALAPWLSANATGTVADRGSTTASVRNEKTSKATKKSRRKQAEEEEEPGGFQQFIRSRNGKFAMGGVGLLLLVGILYAAFGRSKNKDTAKPDNPAPGPAAPAPINPGKGQGTAQPTPGAVARLDAEKIPAFRLVRDSNVIIDGSTPTLPAGWVCEVWNKDATGEFRSEQVDGRPALRVSSNKGTNAAQLVFRPSESGSNKITPDRDYHIRIVYNTDPGIEGYVHTQSSRENDYAMIGRIVLKNQGAGWHTASGTIKPGGKDFQIAIGTTRTVPDKFVSIASVELIPESALPNDKLVYTFDLSRIQPFSFKFQDGQPADQDWRNKVPGGVYLHCWKKESVAEFRGDAADGKASIGVANLNDDNSSQILFQFDEGLNLPLRPGENYRIRLEYRTMNDAEGRADIRNPKGGDFSSIATGRLESTDGKWKTVDVAFRRPVDGKIDICIINNSVGEGNVLSIRSVEVFEVAK